MEVVTDTPTPEIPYYLAVSLGKVPGVTTVNKFGQNFEIDSGVTADIWTGGKATSGTSLIWLPPTTARTHVIASTDADDTTGGSGARTVRIWGLKSWTTAEVFEDVTMDTGTPPTTANAYVIIHRMRVLTTGSGSLRNQGLITATATTDSTVTARIEVGEGSTEMAIYGIPSIQTLVLTDIGGSVGKEGGASGIAEMNLEINEEPNVQLLAYSQFFSWGLSDSGSPGFPEHFLPPLAIPGPAIIKLQCDSGTNNMDVDGWFNGTLHTN